MTRTDLAMMFRGEGAELGVAGGHFSSAILKHGNVTRLWSIDKWNDHHNLTEYKSACELLAKAGRGICIPLRMTFSEAATLFSDSSLDWVFIDGYAHTGQEGGQTLEQWWTKLKPGGIFSGHDYHPDFPRTICAVNEFCGKDGLELHLTDESKYPSWWVTKSVAA